jgi:hypothetical protein
LGPFKIKVKGDRKSGDRKFFFHVTGERIQEVLLEGKRVLKTLLKDEKARKIRISLKNCRESSKRQKR